MEDEDDDTDADPRSTDATIDQRDRISAPELTPRLTGARYQVSERIGKGGQGEVLNARDLQIGRDIAIKRMRAKQPSERTIARFLREARIQGRLDHPAIVPVYELGRDVDGRPFFAMKRLSGTTLAALVRDDEVPTQRLLRAFVDVCFAIELAHTRGVIHRDIKPENVMLGDFGETYVLDWGVAKLVGTEQIEGNDDPDLDTGTGVIIGTRGFMAPEQALGSSNIDARVDVYALGCVLFEILARQPRHLHDDALATFDDDDPHPALRAPERQIPFELDTLCARALAFDRDLRIGSARELGDGVQRYLDGDRDLAARRALAVDHLRCATTAFELGDRTTAMRDAARALALDPRLDAAAQLVTRLMMEPPTQVPPEVEIALDEDVDRTVRRAVKRIAMTNLAYLGFIPFMIGLVHPLYIALLVAIVAVKFAVVWGMTGWGDGVRYARLALNIPILILIVRLTSPVLFAPSIAAITAVGLMSGAFRTRRDGVLVWLGLSLAIAIPALLEYVGALSPTIDVSNGVLAIDAPLLGNDVFLHAVPLIGAGIFVALAIATSSGLRQAERASRRQVRLQAWQLAQLVPRGV